MNNLKYEIDTAALRLTEKLNNFTQRRQERKEVFAKSPVMPFGCS